MLKVEQSQTCAHCGTPFVPRKNEKYCCHGCDYVAQVLAHNDLTRFYELKGKATLPPVGSKAFLDVESEALEHAQRQIEASTDKPVVTGKFNIEGISCIGCVWLIEALFNRQMGAARARIDPRSSTIEISWRREQFHLAEYAKALQEIGYRIHLYEQEGSQSKESKQITHRIGLCGFFLMNTMLFTLPAYLGMAGDFFLAPLFQILGAMFATMAFLIGGSYFIKRAWSAARNRVLHIDLPIAMGLCVAYAGSLIGWATGYTKLIYFDFVATFVFLMLLGRWLQEFALEKNRSHLQNQQFGPKNVTIIDGAQDGESIAPSDIKEGLHYSVAPGEINPVAADPLQKNISLSLEWINGESEPIIWSRNRTVPAGAINVGLEPLTLCAREAWESSMLASLLSEPKNSFQHRRLESILKYYISAVLVIAFAGGLTWILTTGNPLTSIQVFISVLIVSCPCALGVALPLCNEFSTCHLRKIGLFIKDAQIWERIRNVDTVVFDKTGTLTMDIPRLTNRQEILNLDPLATLALYRLVDQNPHPIGKALREALLANQPKLRNQKFQGGIKEETGSGVSWIDPASNRWTLGKTEWNNSLDDRAVHLAGDETVLRQNGLLVAAFNFVEDVRDDASEVIKSFQQQKLDTVILSGDAPNRVQRIGRELALEAEKVYAQCSPQDKADWIHQNAPTSTLMIGDGANDRLAFDAAVCRGTPVIDKSILESSSDFFFFGRSLNCISELISLAKRRRKVVNIIFATGVSYNLCAIALCLSGQMHPLLAAILMPLSSVLTLLIAWFGLSPKMRIQQHAPN